MLVNVSYNDRKIIDRIDREVGLPFSLKEQWSLGGTGSPKLFIVGSSEHIDKLLLLDNNTNSCNIEMRPKGIIVRFRSLLETYALIVPYYKLRLLKTGLGIYTIYHDQYFIKVRADTKAIQKYFTKLLGHRADNVPPTMEDL